jgi:putative hydrolase of the HAD superfamily
MRALEMPPTHVLFDFFGTLVDYTAGRGEYGYERSFGLVERAGTRLERAQALALWDDVYARFEDEAAATHREFSMEEVCGAFLRRALPAPPSDELLRDFVRTYIDEWNAGVRDKPGVPELLERLARRFTLAVVTNTHEPSLVPNHLSRMGVAERFHCVVTSVECGTRKPGARIFGHAIERLAASAERCVFVGDSLDADYRGADSAGMRAFLIDPLARHPVPHDARLESVLALERRLAELA